MSERFARLGLTGILAIFIALASAYAYVTPTLEAPDEIYHYDYVRSLVETGRPPVLVEGGGKNFGHHAPLYYAYGALASFWVKGENSDIIEVWRNRHNPFFGYRFGEVGRDNKNLYLHPPNSGKEGQSRGLPLPSGENWLGVRVVRWASVLLGAVTIWAIYRAGREVFPDRPEMALGAAGLAAFIPEFLFISGAINDDNGAALFGALALWAMMRIAREGPNWRRCIALGLTLGLGWLSKLTVVALLPTAALALLLAVTRHARNQVSIKRSDINLVSLFRWGLVVFGIAALLIAPWLIRQTTLYGDPTGTSREMSEWGLREEPVTLANLGPDLYWLRTSFWGRLGYNQIPLSSWIYDILDVVVLIAILGLIYSSFVIRHSSFAIHHSQFTILSAAFFLTFGPMIVRRFLRPMPNFGRYLFPVLPAIAILTFTGLSVWLPRRLHSHLALGLTAAMLTLGIAGLTCFLAPAYARPPIYETGEAPEATHKLDWIYLEDGQPLARLRGYDLSQTSLKPGGEAEVTLHWEVLKETETDYVLFAQLFGQDGAKVGQRDTYPGLGHYPTSFWQPGQVILDGVPIPIAEDAKTPTRLRLDVGLYAQESDTRLEVVNEKGQPVGATAGWLKLPPRERNASFPPPTENVDYQLGDTTALTGYDVVQQGDQLHLRLHWACMAPMEHDYTVFVHLISADASSGQNDGPAAQSDGPPLDGDYPTSFWDSGEVIVEERTMPTAGLAPGTYQLHVGMYLLETGERLPALDGTGNRLPDDVVPLAEVELR